MLVYGRGMGGKVSAALSRRERSENALVLLPTREEAIRAAKEAEMDARGSMVIVAAGAGYGSWSHPAMNANSSTKSAIVIGTPRGVVGAFFNNGHGRPWLAKVRFLMIVDAQRMDQIGSMKEVFRILKLLPPKQRRKNVMVTPEQPSGFVTNFYQTLLREKRDDVEWNDETIARSLPNWKGQDLGVSNVELAEYAKATNSDGKKPSDQRTQSAKSSKRKGVQTTKKKTLAGSDDDDAKRAARCTANSNRQQVKQSMRHGRHDELFAELVTLMKECLAREGAQKMLVFFPTARMTECYATMCRSLGLDVIDMHARTAVGNRQRGFEMFFANEKAVMFSSEAAANASFLPDINYVIQMGVASTVEQYKRRVDLVSIGDDNYSLVTGVEDEITALMAGMKESEEGLGGNVEIVVEKVEAREEFDVSMAKVYREGLDKKGMQKAYQSWLSYYSSCRRRIGWSRRELLKCANEWASEMFGEVPEMDKRFAGQMRFLTYSEARIRKEDK